MKRRLVDCSAMAVMPAQCRTCPFRERSGPDDLRANIERRLLSGVNQTCHSTGVAHGRRDTHLCRGARNFLLQFFHRVGFLPEPTDAAWDAKRAEGRS